MKQTAKALIATAVFAALLLGGLLLFGRAKTENGHLKIVSVNFPGYDFARAVTRSVENVDLQMLLAPGAEVHDFEPTPEDIKAIQTSDLFIYTGGESDAWVETLIADLKNTKIVKMTTLVDTVEEEAIEGMEADEDGDEEGGEIDEHVWTSLRNAIIIINHIKDALAQMDPAHQARYAENAKAYTDRLAALDRDFQTVIENATTKTLVFGDRFPLRYFVDDYDLKYYAAFPGCSEQTEPSAKTLAFLIDKVKSENIKVVFHIELGNHKIADTIAAATGAKVLEFHSAHNISESDFNSRRTYLDLVASNLAALKEALK